MFWFIIIFLIIIAFYWGYQKNKENTIKDNKDNVIFAKQIVRYITGFQEISGGKVFTNIRLGKEKLFIEFIGKDIIKEINIDKIVDAECKTSEDIIRDVSLGRLIVFGVLAFGMKQNSKVTTKCVVIKYMDEFDKERTLIFETHPDELVKNILNVKRKVLSGS